jgi:hypothetical protein
MISYGPSQAPDGNCMPGAEIVIQPLIEAEPYGYARGSEGQARSL